MRTLLVIDYTNDFVAEDGALTCGEHGQQIDGYIARLMESFITEGEFVVLPTDLHEEQDAFHPETNLYPHITLEERQVEICTDV